MFFNVIFTIEALINKKWKKLQCPSNFIQFSQNEVTHFDIKNSFWSKELTYMINISFK